MPNDISYALKLILPVHHAGMSNVPIGCAFNPTLYALLVVRGCRIKRKEES